jgi:CRP-like cAMP-binding protein
MKEPFQIFKTLFLSIYPQLNEKEWEYLLENAKLLNTATKSIIIEENKLQRHIFFLTSGLVRGFYIDDKGEEITIRFINNTGWITHYSALISNRPSKYIFQTLEQSEIIVLPFDTIQNGYKKFTGLEKIGRLIAESVLKTQQKRIEDFQFLTAEERYLSFIEDYPELFNRVSLSHLCTYLGIKRQSLTRIRKKLTTR